MKTVGAVLTDSHQQMVLLQMTMHKLQRNSMITVNTIRAWTNNVKGT